MVRQSDRTTSRTVRCAASTRQPPTFSPISLRHVSDTLHTHRNGRRPIALSSPSLVRSHIHTQNPTVQSLYSHVLGNCWNRLWQNDCLTLRGCVGQLTPHRWEPNRKTLQSTHFSEPSRQSPTPSVRRGP